MTIKSGMDPVHPGVMLREELDDLGLAASALAEAMDVPAKRIAAILNGECGITVDTAQRLGRYFGTTSRFWLNLQQNWQNRLAEIKAEAIRTAAQQAKAVADQAVSTFKAIEGNLALCDQLGAVELAVRSPTSNQHMLRTVAGPLDELLSGGALHTAFARELRQTARWLAEYGERFRLADPGHVSRLVTQLGAAQTNSAVEGLAAMKNPWLDAENELGSVQRILELRQVGEVIGGHATFSESVADRVRRWLGDWRMSVAWPDDIWRDLAARANFYDGLGFDANLTDLPTAAFREAVELADIRSERPSLVESYGPPVPLPEANEEAAFARTNEAQDWLQRFESHLRRFIDVEMARQFGAEWPRHRLPHGMYHKWRAKQDAAAREGRPPRTLVAYADFTDYSRIIMRKDNWGQVFASYFGRPENVRESFQRLHPIRRDAMHARLISQDDELLLYVEVKRIMRAIES